MKRKLWLVLLAAALAASASLVNAAGSGARRSDVATNVKVWIGLKNSDDVGTSFDLKATVTNGPSTGYGSISNFPGGSSGFNNAHLATIPITNYSGSVGDSVSVTIWVRASCLSKHISGTARLWWNDHAANSGVEDSGFGSLFLVGANGLNSTAGSGPKMSKDVLVKKSGCPEQPTANWKSFGTWTGAPSACAAGSEDFSGFALGSQPTIFSGGTIDSPFPANGGVVLSTPPFNIVPSGGHLLFTGDPSTVPFRLTFTNTVRSVQLGAQPVTGFTETVTLTAYDASDAQVAVDSRPTVPIGTTFSVGSPVANIKYFTIMSAGTTGSNPNGTKGVRFSSIQWGCT
jgi:hypothetical protein